MLPAGTNHSSGFLEPKAGKMLSDDDTAKYDVDRKRRQCA